MARVVFDALAEANLVEHFEVVPSALLDALQLDQLVLLLKKRDALNELRLDGLDRLQYGAAWCDVVAGRVHGKAWHASQNMSGQGIEQRQTLYDVIEHGQTQGMLTILRGEDIDYVAAYAKVAVREVDVVTLVLHLGEPLDGGIAL